MHQDHFNALVTEIDNIVDSGAGAQGIVRHMELAASGRGVEYHGEICVLVHDAINARDKLETSCPCGAKAKAVVPLGMPGVPENMTVGEPEAATAVRSEKALLFESAREDAPPSTELTTEQLTDFVSAASEQPDDRQPED